MATPEPTDNWRRPQGESPSRRKVREFAAKGLSAREIAQLMGITPQAVYQHLRGIRERDAEDQQTTVSS